jgi:dephospho-CoA kinase
MERDGLTEEEARRRMAAQPTNSEYIEQANVIFSTQWEPEYTQKQVLIIITVVARKRMKIQSNDGHINLFRIILSRHT